MDHKVLLKSKAPALVFVALIILFGVISSLLSGCSTQTLANTGGRFKVVATTTMLFDLVAAIGGNQIEATGLMGPGIDPHLYQASAGDVTKMLKADVVVYNGLRLEGKMGDEFAYLSEQGKFVICAEDGVDSAKLLADENNPDIYDPHIWFDVSIWKDVAGHVAACLSKADPAGTGVYSSNLEKYLAELDELDQYIRERVEELPEQQRVLVTAHDAFRYFGVAYKVKVMGLQGVSTDAEAGTADVSNLAEYIARNRIKAIFVESSVPPKNIEALRDAVEARGFAVKIGGQLYSDSLGDEASGHNTYILTLKANIDAIANALK
ncbi:MAG: zinc ABC transporter substrate-binding protein [Clostridiales bacterium]|jgi:manganese/zinc/iron transport system substrate-binding protein|nr:zinc ABC transporter substrate-binding protein [Clostridiales bacterium]